MASIPTKQVELAQNLFNGVPGAATNIFSAASTLHNEKDKYETLLDASKAITDVLQMMKVMAKVIPAVSVGIDIAQANENIRDIEYSLKNNESINKSDLLSLAGSVLGLCSAAAAVAAAAAVSAPVLAVTAGILAVAATATTFLGAATNDNDPAVPSDFDDLVDSYADLLGVVPSYGFDDFDNFIYRIAKEHVLDNGTALINSENLHHILLQEIDINLGDSDLLNDYAYSFSNSNKEGVEGLILYLSDLMGLGAGPLSDELSYYNLVGDIYTEISNSEYSAVSIIHTSTDDLVLKAKQDTAEGSAVRYALLNDKPLAVIGNIAKYIESADILALDNFSMDFLYDRASYVKGVLSVNLANSDGTVGTVVGAKLGLYTDIGKPNQNVWISDDEIRINKSILAKEEHPQVIFGTMNDELIEGGNRDDSLYGMGGMDTLTGGVGSDYLEGGDGGDLYKFENGDGLDEIFDLSGGNNVAINNLIVSTLSAITSNNKVYKNEAGDVFLTKTSNGFIITYNQESGKTDKIEVTGNVNNFGISLIDYNSESMAQPISNTDEFNINDGSIIIDDGNGGLESSWIKFSYSDRSNDANQNWINDRSIVFDANLLNTNNGYFVANPSSEGYSFEGGDNNDTLIGSLSHARPALFGLGGNDLIVSNSSVSSFSVGGLGNDYLVGNGESWLHGDGYFNLNTGDISLFIDDLDGDDILIQNDGSDKWMDGGGGDDVLTAVHGGFGYLAGGSGSDSISGGDDDDLILGDGTIRAGSNSEGIYDSFTIGIQDIQDSTKNYDDNIDAGNGTNQIIGGAGNDVIVSGSGEDHIYGDVSSKDRYKGEGWELLNELASELHGNDFIMAGIGADFVVGGGGNDTIFGEDGDDVLYGEDDFLPDLTPGNNFIDGGGGNDTLYGGNGNDILIGGIGNDIVVAEGGNDQLFGGEGSDILHGDSGNDYLSGGSENDELDGSDGDDELIGNEGDDLIFGGGGSDYLDGGDGDDHLQDTIGSVTGEINILSGGNGNDTLVAGDADDELYGGTGNDVLFSGSGSDTLSGGFGNDQLEGGLGDDTYLFSVGDGIDLIIDDSGDSTLIFNGVIIEDISIINADRLYLIYGSGDVVSFDEESTKYVSMLEIGGTIYSLPELIEELSNKDGNISVTYSGGLNTTSRQVIQIFSSALENSEFVNDIRSGTSGNIFVFGFSQVDPTTDTHVIDPNSEQENIIGDQNYVSNYNLQKFTGDARNNTIIGDFNRNNIIDGGAGDDVLWGGQLSDIYYVDSENDVIGGEFDNGFYGANTDRVVSTALQYSLGDKLEVLELAGEVAEYGGGNDLDNIMLLSWGHDNVTFEGGAGDDFYIINSTTEVIEDPDGGHDTLVVRAFDSEYSLAVNIEDAKVQGKNATLIGNDLDNTLWAYGSDISSELPDWNWGFQPGAAYVEPTGSDLITLAIEDTVNWQVSVSHGSNLQGGGGNDHLYGAELNDTLEGGTGDDILRGGSGRDTYLYSLGDGNDTILRNRTGTGYGDKLILGEGIIETQINFSRGGTDYNDLTIKFSDGGSILVENHFSEDVIDSIDVSDADGEIVTISSTDIRQRAGVFLPTEDHFSTTQNQSITLSVSDLLDNDGGNPDFPLTVTSVSSNYGGVATFDEINQTITFTVEEGYIGQGLFYYYVSDGTFTDNAKVWIDIAEPGPTIINGNETDNTLTGTALDDEIYGLQGNDTLSGGAGDDLMSGGEGDDLLIGGEGDDTLYGKDGNDQLDGGNGNDHYYYYAGTGQDTITDTGDGQDVLFFNDVDSSRLSYHQDGDDLVVLVDGDLDQQVRVVGHFLSGNSAIMVQPNGSYTLTPTDIVNQLIPLPDADNADDGSGDPDNGSSDPLSLTFDFSGDDTVVGSIADEILVSGAGNDELHGLDGDDRLMGGAGNDTYVIGSGEGSDTIIDTSGINTIHFTDGLTFSDVASGLLKSGDDLILSVAGGGGQVRIVQFFSMANTIESMTFDDSSKLTAAQIYGAFGLSEPTATATEGDLMLGDGQDNSLTGTANIDTLLGGRGSDTLAGLAGDDQLIGGVGDDTYVIGSGSGKDIVIDTEGSNSIKFVDGISFYDVARGLTSTENDLIINIARKGTKVTVSNFFAIANTIDQITFESGYSLTSAQLYRAFRVSAPTATATTEDLLTNVIGGTTSNDIITGTSADEFISGYQGNDELSGGAGNDVIDGGSGNDRILFGLGDGQDIIVQNDTDTAAAYNDVLAFESDVSYDDLWFSRSGDNLRINVAGTDDQVTIAGWYNSDSQKLDQFESDSLVLIDQQVEQLVSAMASYDVPSGAGNVIPQSVKDDLQPVLAASWQ